MPVAAGRSTEARTIASVGTTNASTALTAPADSFHEEDVGRAISGTGIPAGATIVASSSPTSATLSANATATGSIAASLARAAGSAYGFEGWSPETDAESETYTVAAVNAGTVTPSKITAPTERMSQKVHRSRS